MIPEYECVHCTQAHCKHNPVAYEVIFINPNVLHFSKCSSQLGEIIFTSTIIASPSSTDNFASSCPRISLFGVPLTEFRQFLDPHLPFPQVHATFLTDLKYFVHFWAYLPPLPPRCGPT